MRFSLSSGILVSNTDNHLRNHGFLRVTTGGWSLSPAFDLNPDPEPGVKLLGTGIDGRSNAGAAAGGWRESARRAGLSGDSIAQMESAFQHTSAGLAREIRAELA
jgi:hypothetical protein